MCRVPAEMDRLLYPAFPVPIMATVDLIDLIDQRLADIEEDDPEVVAEETYFIGETGPFCLITVYDEETEEVIEFEFIETEESWKRPDAVLEYNEAAVEEIEVIVVVPDRSFVQVAELIGRFANPEIAVSDYSAMNLIATPLVS
jgi:hypothetical protein